MDPISSKSGILFTPLMIERIHEETRDFKTIVFRDGHQITYRSGQFITLVEKRGEQEIRRSYSMVSSPALNEPLSIAVKRIDNGFFSRKLVDLAQVGDQVLTTGASGFFCLPQNIKFFTEIFFFAAGSGITPVLSLIKTILHHYPELKIRLVYSNRSLSTAAFYDTLKTLEKKFPKQLHIYFLFSSESDLRRARLNRDLLIELLTIRSFDHEKTLFYVCGPEAYMRMVIFLLLEEGYPKENIKKEDFNPGNKKNALRTPPDKKSHRIRLDLFGNHYDFTVHFPDTILQAAKKLKLELPYSCETGKCGSCAATCISGMVWLSNNEVLTDQDLRNGLTLTCTGYPQNDNVVLRFG